MLALRSFQIFGAHWMTIARAYLAPTGLAILYFGAAFLVFSVVRESGLDRSASAPLVFLIGLIAGAVGMALIEPLVITSLLLAVATALWEDLPYPPGFTTSIELWPEQAKIAIPSFLAAALVYGIGYSVWVTTVVPAGKPVLETLGLILVVMCFAGAAVLAFLGTVAAAFVAVEANSPSEAIVKAFDLLFVHSAAAGVSAAVVFGVLLAGLPVLTDRGIVLLAQAVNLPLLALLMGFVPFVFHAVAVTFALLFVQRANPA